MLGILRIFLLTQSWTEILKISELSGLSFKEKKFPKSVVESHSLEILKPTILLKPALGESALAGGWTR